MSFGTTGRVKKDPLETRDQANKETLDPLFHQEEKKEPFTESRKVICITLLVLSFPDDHSMTSPESLISSPETLSLSLSLYPSCFESILSYYEDNHSQLHSRSSYTT
jgi:hypothetical protein